MNPDDIARDVVSAIADECVMDEHQQRRAESLVARALDDYADDVLAEQKEKK